MKTLSGRILSLSPLHLLPVIDCNNTGSSDAQEYSWLMSGSIFASKAHVNDCVLVKTDDQMRREQIVEVKLKM